MKFLNLNSLISSGNIVTVFLIGIMPSLILTQTPSLPSKKKIKTFSFYNALLYEDTPDLTSDDIHKIFLFYEDDLLSNDPLSPDNFSKRTISEEKIRQKSLLSLKSPNVPVCLDIESWPKDDKEGTKSLEKYLKVLDIFKSTNSRSKFGYFGFFPHLSSPEPDVKSKNPLNIEIFKWDNDNAALKKIATESKIFYPEFYTLNDDILTWEKMVKDKVSKIKAINANAVIYGFVWPNYFSNDGKYLFLPDKLWSKQLEIIYKYCDGAVIWSHYNGPDGKKIKFSRNMPWFISTKKFIKQHNIK